MSVAPSTQKQTGSVNPTTGHITKLPASADPGAGLLQEAEGLILGRRWREATKVLEAARSVGCQSPRFDELMAVAASHAGRRDSARLAVAHLRSRDNQTPASAIALARVALTNRQFSSADAMARQALAADPYSTAGWYHLAASFCALGWFDEAKTCIESSPSEPDDPNDKWFVGRAINHWAMSKTRTTLVTVIAVVIFGVIGLAVGLAVPFVTREVRVANLPEGLRSIATDQWKTEHRLRITIALAVLAVVIVAVTLPTMG